jgi:DNA-binding beta-propeller fold protein YncE
VTTDATILPAGPATELDESPEEAPEDERRRRRKAILFLLLLGALVILMGLIIWYLLYRQPIPPIPVIPSPKLPAYSTAIYGANAPAGVAVTRSGDRIFVAETSGDRITRILDPAGNQLGTMVPPAETGADHVPVYVAIDPLTNEVYVTDRPTGSIYVYNGDGAFQREFRPAVPIPGWQPLGITFDRDGNLYVTDLGGKLQTVRKFNRSGELAMTFGESEGLNFPNGLALDADGRLYLTDSNNGRLLVFDQAGAVVAKIGRGAGAGNLGLPRGLAIDNGGRLFIVDSSGQGVLVYATLGEGDSQPEYYGFFGGHGFADGQFAFPIGVAVDDRGRVYVADTANNRVQMWSY